MPLTQVNAQMLDGAITANSSGNVGIGTSSPGVKLDVSGGDFRIQQSASTARQRFVAGSNQWNVETSNSTNGYAIYDAAAGQLRFFIDGSGRVTIASQPYCLVGKSNGNVSPPNVIVHNQIAANIGSSYNSSNGRFTAPISGNYFISINALGTTSNGVEVSIRKNGGTVLNTREGGAVNYTSTSTSSVVYLASGDYIENWAEGAYAIEGNNGYAYTGMAVYLLG